MLLALALPVVLLYRRLLSRCFPLNRAKQRRAKRPRLFFLSVPLTPHPVLSLYPRCLQELKKKELEEMERVLAELGIATPAGGAEEAAGEAGAEGKKKKKKNKDKAAGGEAEAAPAPAPAAEEESEPVELEDPEKVGRQHLLSFA